MQELWFLRSAHCLILIDIHMKFREGSLNGFQVIEKSYNFTEHQVKLEFYFLQKHRCLPPFWCHIVLYIQ